MLLGKISGKVTTHAFSFDVTAEVKNLEYIKVYHPVYDYVLCQVVELTATTSGSTALCNIIGYRDKDRVKAVRIPFEPGTEVFMADDEFITDIIALPEEDVGAYLGKLEGRDIPIHIDLRRMMTKHVAVLAKSGAGKSYTVGVLLEEILEKGVPVLIIDPHGEHHTLNTPAKIDEENKERYARYEVMPKGYEAAVYGNPDAGRNPLLLSNKLTRQELMHMLPKLNVTQQGLLYQAIRNSEHTDFDQLLLALEAEESMAKWSLINLVEGLRNHKLFSSEPTPPTELVKPGRATIIELKGYPPDIQELIVYKLVKDLFELRKHDKRAPFFLVLEEAHNFCPERSFGEAASSKILRTIASEGRKFGLGLCVISQRPARVDKSVLSQCTTQLVLKVTNPHDLKAVSNSVEGLTAESEKEIKNLSIGTALVAGVVDLPLVVNVRPRRTAHGGEAVDILDNRAHQTEETNDAELLPVIMPNVTPKDLELMNDEEVNISTILRPVGRFICTDKKGDDTPYTILVDLARNEIITDIEGKTKKLPVVHELGTQERDILRHLFKHKRVNPGELNIPVPIMQKLLASGYIVLASKDAYKLSGAYHFTKLRKASIAAPVTYERIGGEKRQARYSLDEAATILGRYAKVTDEQECWLVQYKVKSKH
ncbi:ATP-binding protein [Candidatus Woesearchaeota archaeon]|nr:ATP-binding protein [Candidatus Woesearchaeota archaeon]